MDSLSQLFALLSEPSRMKLLVLLSQGEQCVCKLYEALEMQQSTVSRHLMLLRTAGLLSSKRVEQWVHYRLAPELWKPEWQKLLPDILTAAKKQYPELTLKQNGCQSVKSKKPAKNITSSVTL
ncbi:MAG: metalloregulator ArsR/SmtB family transcription factor [bacterium]|nr:metalloregulator ArsR/SmtB family transcription factor [bacterium]